LLQRESCLFNEGSTRSARAVLVGVVRGEQNAFGSDQFKRALKIGLTPHATGRHVKILPNVVGYRPLQLSNTSQGSEPFQIEEHNFAPMAQDDLQIGIFIEDTGQDQTNELDTGFVVPPKANVANALSIWLLKPE
jgi:hypothetical protein